ncbi:MAG: hypothetical protein ACPIOQ_56520 [Promethearchaeia archaeon]
MEEGSISREALKERPPAMLHTMKLTPVDEKNGQREHSFWLCGKCDKRCESDLDMERHANVCQAVAPQKPANMSLAYLEDFFGRVTQRASCMRRELIA